MCNRFPAPVYAVVHTRAVLPATPPAALRLRVSVMELNCHIMKSTTADMGSKEESKKTELIISMDDGGK